MAAQQPSSAAFFYETRPVSIRLWHWLAFLFFTASIVTVLFASTMFKTKSNIAMVQQQVQQQGGTITPKQAQSIAHEYSDKLWMLHKYIGFGLSFLLLWRIVAEVAISKEKRLSTKLKKALSLHAATEDRQHYLMVEYGYLIFYVLFIGMALTGLVLAFEDVEWLKPVHKLAKNVHSFLQYGMYGYIIIHIAGVVIADVGKYSGIVSRMINGKVNEN
jgi:cytochrome b561